jgi:very-short-patch-repair endonuclease
MRHHPTYSEALLWSAIRGQRLGVQFRRQQVIGNHIVDFLARKASLIVEVDGDVLHEHQVTADARRDERLRRAGYRVVRIPASHVERDLEAAAERVREALVGLASK